jgi:hypothetical protein
MSLKSLTNRRLSSIKSLQIPVELKKDLNILNFFNQLFNNIFEIYNILIDNLKFETVSSDTDLTENKRLLVTEDNITLTLPTLPADYQQFTIQNLSDTVVEIISSEILIKDSLNYTITNKFDNITIIYIKEVNLWLLI